MNKKTNVYAITAIFLLLGIITSCSKDFNITGNWAMTQNFFTAKNTPLTSTRANNGKKVLTDNYTISFTGSISSGTFYDSYFYQGTYTINGDNITLTYPNLEWTFTGTASQDHNTVSGTWTDYNSGVFVLLSTFTMTRL